MFKVSGIWVSPFEVEQALISHAAILEAAVVAAADDEGLEKPKAYIVMKNAEENIDAEELKEFVKAENRKMEISSLGRGCGRSSQNGNWKNSTL